ncbi:MAG: hypothetical protein EA340_06765 [Nitriliruptor sp.]|nr:MAG: hypothetical protein EA340_06765 [Nitriliruptor sp.]
MADQTMPGRGVPDWVVADRAVSRLQELLEQLPRTRALPDLDALLAQAGADRSLLADERARKLIDEALRDRPLSCPEEIRVLRTEVELLTVEVGVLEERLTDPNLATADRAVLQARLRRIRGRWEQLADQL